MKQKHQSICLAGLLALAVGLSACSSWRGGSMGSSGGMSGTGGGTGPAGSSGSSGTAGSSSGYDSASTGMMQNQGASAMPMSPNATVASIEALPRSSSSATEGNAGASAAMGSSSGGATGSSSADRIYRVTLRMDDGSTQVVTQQTTPDFRTGDRVSLAGGMIQH
ncbi:hypothetical protein HAV22_27320 [Massilia sp. TW-1]|uniref:Lipoprotein n=1 Tax=Telluria antibiotica TaxID=2717319 RepID=A0ABX0PNB6_9BURK|nr:hypothetical protein [Telluria antibiotica]NIA57340.1 hypothetical protein [Telluria antibiotica]